MLIGTTGKARVGKDTFTEMMVEELYKRTRSKFIMMAFANELKLRVQKDFDLSYDQLWGDSKEVEDTRYVKPEGGYWTGREIMQAYGEFYRSINKSFWVDNLFKTIEEKEYNNVVITDVRHPNEADPIKEHDGYIIKVTSDRRKIQDIHGNNHISEVAMDNYENIDFHVRNDGTLEDLRVTAKQVVAFLLESEKFKKVEV
jgi:hypothetical protein